MFLPISHDKMKVRRMPVVTIALIFVTVACHVLVTLASHDKEQGAMRALVAARTMYVMQPALGVCGPLASFVDESDAAAEAGAGALAELAGRSIDGGDDREAREEYEKACADLDEAVRSIPSQRLGYVPARMNVTGLFTYVFVHGDVFHLVGNMWFLFLCGLALEDRWGRLAFPVYYLVAGVVAAGAHHLATRQAAVPLIGASGAVAGAMGAFLVLYATSRIRFVAFFGVRFVSFHAPAYVMLPLWVAIEVVYALVLEGSQTAHWAHVGGFAFGVAVAAAFRIAGVDRKLDDAVERAAVLGDDPRVDAARAMLTKGEAEQAALLLEGLAKEKPESIHVWEALRDAAEASGDSKTAEDAAARAAELAAAKGRPSVPRASTPSVPKASSPSVPRASVTRPSTPGVGASVSGAVRSTSAMKSAPRASGSGTASAAQSATAAVSATVEAEPAAPFFPAPPRK